MEEYKKRNLDSYNKNAVIFSEHFKDLFNLDERKEFKNFLSLLNGRKILDLGCGSGDHALWFKEKGFDVKCVDISQEFIKICKEKELDAEAMDIEDLKFNNNSFDGIWAVTSLLHVPKSKIKEVIDKLFDILKDRGVLFVSLKEGEGEKYVKDKLNSETERYFVYWKKDEFVNFLKDNFELVDFFDVRKKDTKFLNFSFRKKRLSQIS